MYKIYFKCGCNHPYKDCMRHKKPPACPTHNEILIDKITFTCENCGVETDKKAVGGEKITRAGNARQFCEQCHIMNSHQALKSCRNLDRQSIAKEFDEDNSPHNLIENKWDCASYGKCIDALYKSKAKHLPCKGCAEYKHKPLDIEDYIVVTNPLANISTPFDEFTKHSKKLINFIDRNKSKAAKDLSMAKWRFLFGNKHQDRDKNIKEARERGKSL